MKVRMRVSALSLEPRKCSQRSFCYAKCLSLFLLGLYSILCFCSAPAQAQSAVVLVGSGSSVPAPLYNRWAQEFAKRNTKVQMRYVPIGTSEGIKQISHGAGDFGAGEALLTSAEKTEGNLVALPAVLIGIVPIYNLPSVHQELRLSGEVLAGIFLGEVKMWDAPAIAKLNPEVTLPNLRIQVVNRPAGKGSNYVFTDFLSKVSSKFRSQIGVNASPDWPVGVPAERSADMVEKVKNAAGAIGFVESQYAVKANLPQVAVLNPAGKYVKASAESIEAACEAVEAPHWNKFATSLTNASGADSFPITSFTWIYLRAQSSDSTRAAAMQDLLDWIYSDGQQFAAQEGYSELPPALLAAVRKKVKDMR
jgi:phosphate transport system substrate-binding protein